MCKFVGRKKGLTLIEVVISLAILVIVVPPILSMILSSVKTNKRAENEQQALYVAQQCIEDIKSEPIDDTMLKGRPITPTPKGDLKFKIEVTRDEKYCFNDKSSSSQGYDAIRSDKEIVIDLNDSHIFINVYKTNGTKDEEILKELSDEVKNKIKNIIQDPNILIIINEKSEIHNVGYIIFNGKMCCFSKETENGNEKSGYLKIKFKGYNDKQLKQEKPSIKVNVLNYSEEVFTVYIAEEKEKKVNYSVENNFGKVRLYSNIYVNKTDAYINDSRLYKINVKVWEKGQNVSSDKPIKELNAYKTALE